MFIITRIQDTVVLEPTMLKEPLHDAICYALNECVRVDYSYS